MKRDNYNTFGQWEFSENEALKLCREGNGKIRLSRNDCTLVR